MSSNNEEKEYTLKHIGNHKTPILLINDYKKVPTNEITLKPLVQKEKEVNDEEYMVILKEEHEKQILEWGSNNLDLNDPLDLRRDSLIDVLKVLKNDTKDLLKEYDIPIRTIDDLIKLPSKHNGLYNLIIESNLIEGFEAIIKNIKELLLIVSNKLIAEHGEKTLDCIEHLENDEIAKALLKVEANIKTVKDLALFPENFSGIYSIMCEGKFIRNIEIYVNEARKMLGLEEILMNDSYENTYEYIKDGIDSYPTTRSDINILSFVDEKNESILKRYKINTIQDLACIQQSDFAKYYELESMIPSFQSIVEKAIHLYTCLDN